LGPNLEAKIQTDKYFLLSGLENINIFYMLTSIKLKLKHTLRNVLILGSLGLPFLARAQNAVQNGLQTSGLQSLFGAGGLTGSLSLGELIANIIQIMLLFAAGIAIVFVIIGGYYYITASGNEEQAEKGKSTLLNAIIGIILIIMAYVIINVIVNLVSSSSGYGF
jgi:hypothetical protein